MTAAVAPKPRKGRAKEKTGNCAECGAVDNRHFSSCSKCENRCAERMDGERCDKFAGHQPPCTSTTSQGLLTWNLPPPDAADPLDDIVEVVTDPNGSDARVIVDAETGEVKQAELIATPIEERARAIGRKEAEIDRARAEKKRLAQYVKDLEAEHKAMVRDLIASVGEGATLSLPFSIPQAVVDRHEASADDDAGDDSALTGAERRALAMAADPPDDEPQPQRAAVDVETISQRHPGVYVTPDDGPVD